jgi:hypothetical protein
VVGDEPWPWLGNAKLRRQLCSLKLGVTWTMAEGETSDPTALEQHRIACHEAAHALAAREFAEFGSEVADIDLDAQVSAKGLGATSVKLPDPSAYEDHRNRVAMMSLIIVCAGAASDAAELSEPLLQAWAYQEGDQSVATQVLDRARIPKAERESLTEEALKTAASFVEGKRDDIHALADLLLEKRRLSKADVLAWCHAPLAIHEAAHAVVGEALGLTLLSIEIDFDQWQGGAKFDLGFGPEMWRKDVLVSLAGEAAQRRVDPDGRTLHDEQGNRRAADDMQKVDIAVGQFNRQEDSEVEDRISEARITDGRAATSELLDLLWPAIQAVAAAIEAGNGTVGAADFRHALNAAMPAEQRVAAVQQIDFVRRPYNVP